MRVPEAIPRGNRFTDRTTRNTFWNRLKTRLASQRFPSMNLSTCRINAAISKPIKFRKAQRSFHSPAHACVKNILRSAKLSRNGLHDLKLPRSSPKPTRRDIRKDSAYGSLVSLEQGKPVSQKY